MSWNVSIGKGIRPAPPPSPRSLEPSDWISYPYLSQKSSLISYDPHSLFPRHLQPLALGLLSSSL